MPQPKGYSDDNDESGKTHKRPPAPAMTPEALALEDERDVKEESPPPVRRVSAAVYPPPFPTQPAVDPMQLAELMANLVAGETLTIPAAEWSVGGLWFTAASALLRRGKHKLVVIYDQPSFLVVLEELY